MHFVLAASGLSTAAAAATVNATITDGVLTYLSPNPLSVKLPLTLGPKTSALNSAITAYFPAPSAADLGEVWVNSAVYSYLSLSGSYDVDVPLMLPSRFMLVLDGAKLSAAPSLVPANNTLAPDATTPPLALIVARGVQHTGVVGVKGGANRNFLSCENLQSLGRCPDSKLVGPAGILVVGSSDVSVSGLTVEQCGLGSAAVLLEGSGPAEVSGVNVKNPACAGVSVSKAASSTVVHDTEVCLKQGLERRGCAVIVTSVV